MKLLNDKDIKELLIKCWMTHDGMWFLHCLRKVGIKKTNTINKAASRGLGLIEAKRFKKVFGITEVKSFNELKEFIEGIFQIVKGEFMKFTFNFSKHNIIQCEMHQCFAHDGIKRIGVIEQYNCGIYDRIEGWFEGLGIKYGVYPQINGCLKYQGKKCIRNYSFNFPNVED
ncbi:MAG: DUF6125 family protein [Candidatus Hermodarchaeota archaeon]